MSGAAVCGAMALLRTSCSKLTPLSGGRCLAAVPSRSFGTRDGRPFPAIFAETKVICQGFTGGQVRMPPSDGAAGGGGDGPPL